MLERIKSFFGPQDMTHGNPMTNLAKFAFPLLIGNFAQQLYSTVDSIVVGKYVGDTALAAIGASLPIFNLLLVLFMAISTGASIMVAQYFGARDKENLSKSIGTSLTLILISSAVIMAIGIPLVRPLLRLVKTPAETFDMAADYLTIILIGLIGCGFYNIISGILRGLGDSLYPLLFLLIASVLNIGLDLWFVIGFGWGVPGVAWATIISQGISAVFCVWRMASMREIVRLDRQTLKPRKDLAVQLFKLGLPAGLTQAIFSLAMVTVQSLANSMGYQVVACTTAVMRIDGFAMLPNFTFGLAVSTFVGQNVGARRMDRVDQGTKAATKLSLMTSAVLVLSLLLFSRQLIVLFTKTQDIIDLGMHQIRILAVGYMAMAITQVFGGVMRGAGDTMPSMWISLFTTVVVRVPVAYIWAYFTRSELNPAGSPDALFFSLLICWVVGALVTYLWYRRGKWRDKSIVRPGAQMPAEPAEGNAT